MKKILGIGGEPATGKSSVAFQLYDALGLRQGRVHKYKTLEYHVGSIKDSVNVCLLGRYDGQTEFVGTDRLSMNVLPAAVSYLNGIRDNTVVVFEGDRLFSRSFLDGLEGFERRYIILLCDEKVLQFRRERRGSNNQSEAFLRGRKTKYMNLIRELPGEIYTMRNNTYEDHDRVFNKCMEFING